MKKVISHLAQACVLPVIVIVILASQVSAQVGCAASFNFYQTPNTLTFNFTDASTSPNAITSWSWNFGDSNTSTSQNPSHTYSLEGTYNVCLTIHDNHGCSSHICHTVICHHLVPHFPHDTLWHHHDTSWHHPHDTIFHHPHDSIHIHHIWHHPHDSIFHHSHHHPHRTLSGSDKLIDEMQFIVYPNPINSSSAIQYELAEPAKVTIEIYDLLGNRIVRVVNEYESAGLHTQNLNAENLSGGFYVIRMTAGEQMAVKKIAAIK